MPKTEEKKKSSKEATAYCMKCKKTRTVENPKRVKMKNGRPALKGECSKCGTKVFKIGG